MPGVHNRPNRPTAALAAAVVAMLVLSACAGTGDGAGAASTTSRPLATEPAEPPTTRPDPGTSAPPTKDPEPAPIVWDSCGGQADCATLAVPLDYDDPSGPTIDIAVARRTAGDPSRRIGSLFFNPGGPGASGVDFIEGGFTVTAETAERFDLISWDPRGVGDSTPVTCGDTLDEWMATDPSPTNDSELADLETAAQAFADECAAADADLLPNVGTADVIRDMDQIRRALGEDQISYIGLSYGTYLGQRYLETYPGKVRAMVFDGVVDAAQDLEGFATGQAEGLQRALDELFRQCDAGPCAVDDARSTWDQILEQVEVAPLMTDRGLEVGPAEAQLAATYVTYDEGLWDDFTRAMADATNGDGTALASLANGYLSLANLAAYASVMCVDWQHPGDIAGFADLADRLRAVSPNFGDALGFELLPCAYWPAGPERAPAPITAPGSPPVLVVGNTGDAATPYVQAERLAGSLNDAVLLTYEGEGHLSLGKSTCVDGWISTYLVDLTRPPADTVC